MRKNGVYVLMLSVLLTACNGSKRDAGAAAVDSLAVDTVHVPTLEELTLPDTAYASVASVKYVVEHEDSAPALLKYYDDLYDRCDRVMTFRKNLMRNADFGGRVEGIPQEIEVAWSFDTPYGKAETRFGQWGGGTGWTGQPLYVHWKDINQLDIILTTFSKYIIDILLKKENIL